MYNWLKYKVTPASFIFRNRLYVERDSKNKKIFAALGSHFKGSKWSAYSGYSIKSLFKIKYASQTSKFFLILMIAVFFFMYSNYYIKTPFFNTIFYFIWIGIDCASYYLALISWFFVLISIKLVSLPSLMFLNNSFSQESDSFRTVKLFTGSQTPETLIYKKKFLSKEDINFYSNLWLSLAKNEVSPSSIENFFQDKFKSDNYAQNINLLKLNFLIVKLLNVSSLKTINYSCARAFRKLSIDQKESIFTNLNQYSGDRQWSSNMAANYLFFSQSAPSRFETSIASSLSTQFLEKNTRWSLRGIIKVGIKTPFLKKTKTSPFFLEQINQKPFLNLTLNEKNFKTIDTSIKRALQAAKSRRWLYRYSSLHRKSVKFVNKIIASKNANSFSSLNQNFFSKTLWEPAFSFVPNNFFESLILPQTLSLKDSKQTSNTLSFYESSYLWFLKRSTELNTPVFSDFTLKPVVFQSKETKNIIKKDNISEFFWYSMGALNASSLINAKYSLDYKQFLLENRQTGPSSILTSEIKDLYVATTEVSFFEFDIIKALVIAADATPNLTRLSFTNTVTEVTTPYDCLAFYDSTAEQFLNINLFLVLEEKLIDTTFFKDFNTLININ